MDDEVGMDEEIIGEVALTIPNLPITVLSRSPCRLSPTPLLCSLPVTADQSQAKNMYSSSLSRSLLSLRPIVI